MLRKRNVSVYSDFKTGFLCKLFLFLGFVFLVFLIVQNFTSIITIDENTVGVIIGFTVLFCGLGFITYFLSCQFVKLAKIAEEIENEDTLDNVEKTDE